MPIRGQLLMINRSGVWLLPAEASVFEGIGMEQTTCYFEICSFQTHI